MTDFPQRIVLSHRPGDLLNRLSGIHARLRLRAPAESDPTYLDQIRQCPCLKCGMDPCGEAAHVRLNSAAFGKRQAIGKKPADAWALPLCSSCHTRDADSQHKVGEALFWHLLGINPLIVCTELYAQRGDVVAMRAVIFKVIAERSGARP